MSTADLRLLAKHLAAMNALSDFVKRPHPSTELLMRHHEAEFRDALVQHLPLAHHVATTAALCSVLDERKRQLEIEGWTAEHDDEHIEGAMATAAACYALSGKRAALEGENAVQLDNLWKWTGWANKWFKPKDTRRDLVRAAALILAEIERLDRQARKEGGAA